MNAKILKYISWVLVILTIYMNSCKSGTPLEPPIVEPIVDISMKTNRDTLVLGDTLYVTIKNNTKKKYSSIILDLLRSKITFNKPLTDTTISYVHDWSSNYNISLSIVDSISILKKIERRITVLDRFFNLSFKVGSKWKYSYSHYSVNPPQNQEAKQNGIQYWEILSSEIKDLDTVYNVIQITENIKIINGINTSLFDTTFAKFVVKENSVKLSCWSLFGYAKEYTIPNRQYVGRYPYTVASWANTQFDDKAGPISYDTYSNSSHGSELSEHWKLISFTKPK